MSPSDQTSPTTPHSHNPEAVVGDLIDKQATALVGSVDADGFPCTKAMLAPRLRDGIRVFYFTTNTSSQRVGQFRQNPRASIYFFDPQFFRGVLLRGNMEVLEDAASKELIWRDGDASYYSGGVTDPDYCVLRFTATNARFYANFHSGDFTIPAG